MQAQENKDDYIKIRFVDSQRQPIPYFASHFVYFSNNSDELIFKKFIMDQPWDELLPYQNVGGGIMPLKQDKPPFYVDDININFEMERLKASRERYKHAGLQEPYRAFVWYFPDGQIHIIKMDDLIRLPKNLVNVVEIPGDLGSGNWKKLGEFLFDASYYWRADRGSKNELLKRCNELIEEKQQARDIAWEANLVFVREHWLGGNSRVGFLARAGSPQTPELDKELPWKDSARAFGREGAAIYSYPLKPYLSFKKVLTTNPKNSRAIFWTRMLPWVNGFSLADSKSGKTSVDYIRECKRVYMEFKNQIDEYHRFWFLKEFLKTCYGMTYEARWWLKNKEESHALDLEWATKEIDSFFARYPFLQYQLEEMNQWLQYMKDPNTVEPVNQNHK